jgi:septum formation protein
VGVEFTVRVPEVEELSSGDPASVTLENAGRKARAVRIEGSGETIIGCDTVVALEGAIYGKPSDEAQARRTLMALSGSTHEVVSGLVVLSDAVAPAPATTAHERTAVARTEVTFAELDGARLDWYLATGEWRGRAGGYAIQGAGAALVRSVRGDYENVVGLPLASLLELCPELLPGG